MLDDDRMRSGYEPENISTIRLQLAVKRSSATVNIVVGSLLTGELRRNREAVWRWAFYSKTEHPLLVATFAIQGGVSPLAPYETIDYRLKS